MSAQTYNQAIVELAQAGLSALAERKQSTKAIQTPAAESHFLCSFLVQALKERRFSKLVADDINTWIRNGRSMGAGAQLPALMQRIDKQYLALADSKQLGDKLQAMLAELGEQDWVVIVDCDVDTKLKLDSDGSASLVIDVSQFEQHIDQGEVVKAINIFVRADEQQLAAAAAKHGLLLSQGNKKTSLVKHHKTYVLQPNNQQPALGLLVN
ncbi:DUF2913 family protein [Shewanella waksmanii]|uniref:DUF2913 family protein n=1 Tax=Shewanella waksmanii TaxID=213783 RepID=UPI00048C404C|nr:DUF2913 family protein [Shewanella waksmanii]